MTVSDLIELLQKYPPDMLVAAEMYSSEQYLITPEDLKIDTLCKPRPDGWVQNYRTDKETQDYLVIRGN